jgi:oligosaccharyltransferase complex subunit delta (ribophorin II)
VYGAPAKASNHGLSSTFTQSDVATLKTFLQSQSETTNIHNAFYATQGLALLDIKPTKATELCTLAKNTLRSKTVVEALDVESIFHAAAVAQVLKCDVTVDKAVTDAIETVIEEGGSVSHYYAAVFATLALRAQTKKEITDDELTAVIEKLGDLTESDGTVRGTKDDKEGSLYNTGLVLQIYARIVSEIKLSEQDEEHVDELVSKVETIVEFANEGENTLSFSDAAEVESTLETTAELVRGFATLAKALKKRLDVTPTQLAQLGEYFLSHKYTSSLEDAYYLLVGLRAVQQSDKSPLALTVEKSSILATAKGPESEIRIRLTDIFDHPIVGQVTLIKLHAIGKPDAVLLQNQEVKDNTFNILAVKPDQGFYVVEFRAVPADANKHATIDSATRRVKIIGSVAVTDLEVLVSDSRETHGEGTTYKADYPKAIDESIHALQTQFVHVSFRVRNHGTSTQRPLTVQQAFVRFVNTKTGNEAIFVATPNDNKAYSVVINIEDSARSQFLSLSGDYTVSVVVGDAFVQNPVSWVIAKNFNIQFPESSKVAKSHDALAAKPVIIHQFKNATERPAAATATLFTGLTLAPLLVFFAGLIAAGANISKFPTDSDFFSAVAFVVTIGLVLALIVLYWLALNLVQTLGYLAILSIPTLFFGNRALSALARKEK